MPWQGDSAMADALRTPLLQQQDVPPQTTALGNLQQSVTTLTSAKQISGGLISKSYLDRDAVRRHLGGCTVQFLSTSDYIIEGAGDTSDGSIQLEVVRNGDLSKRSTVSFATEDRSAKAGKRYIAEEGTLTFEPGEAEKFIKVQIVQDETYVPVCAFSVALSNPVECTLPEDRRHCRVTMMDDDCFPSNAMKPYIKEGRMKQVPVHVLLLEFYKFVLRMEGVGRKAKIQLVGDQIKNLYTLFTNYVNAYLVSHVVNTVVTEDDAASKLFELYVVALCFVAPYGILFLWERFKANMGIPAHLSNFLKGSVVRTYFNATDDVRAKLNPLKVTSVLLVETDAVAHQCFDGLFKLFQAAGSIGVTVFFMLNKAPAFAPFMVGIIAIFSYFLWKEIPAPSDEDPTKAKLSAGERLGEMVHHVADHHRLIEDYDHVSFETDQIKSVFDEMTNGSIKGAVAGLPKAYTPTLLCQALAMVYIAVAGSQVLEGTLPLGTFTVIAAAIPGMGKILKQAEGSLLTVLKSVKPLISVAVFLQLESDIPKRLEELDRAKDEHKNKREVATAYRAQLPETHPDKILPVRDLIDIEMTNVSLNYADNKVISNFSVIIPQGSITAVVGGHSSGKASLIKLLGRILVPSNGHVFVPCHLASLHVGRSAEFFRSLSFTENLNYGLREGTTASYERMEFVLKEVCKLSGDSELGLESELLKNLRMDRDKKPIAGGWASRLTSTELYVMHLARALIYNAEFTVMERVLDVFNKDAFMSLLQLCREHVDTRGLGYAGEEKESRRPRTLIFATVNSFKPSEAGGMGRDFPHPPEIDFVWETDTEGNIKTYRSPASGASA